MPLPFLHFRSLYRRINNSHTLLITRHFMATSDPINPSNTRLGWIGTGVMGQSMCAHLIRAGYTLTVFNRTPSKAQPLLNIGAHLANSPHSVASQSDVFSPSSVTLPTFARFFLTLTPAHSPDSNPEEFSLT
jgi:lactate dehydrogenase-like 2-hydroxyacid dehydrogenase